jgi:hypothetical protein
MPEPEGPSSHADNEAPPAPLPGYRPPATGAEIIARTGIMPAPAGLVTQMDQIDGPDTDRCVIAVSGSPGNITATLHERQDNLRR